MFPFKYFILFCLSRLMAVQDAPFYGLKFDCIRIVSNMSTDFSQHQFKKTFENLNQITYLTLFLKFHKQNFVSKWRLRLFDKILNPSVKVSSWKFKCLLSLTQQNKWTGCQQDTIRIPHRIPYEILEFNRIETRYHRIPQFFKKNMYIFFKKTMVSCLISLKYKYFIWYPDCIWLQNVWVDKNQKTSVVKRQIIDGGKLSS